MFFNSCTSFLSFSCRLKLYNKFGLPLFIHELDPDPADNKIYLTAQCPILKLQTVKVRKQNYYALSCTKFN